MALQEIHSWTLGGLIGAFIDLVLAYFLLCGSALAFFASKFFRIFGLYLPCPCKGSFGYRNSSLCVHKILFEWPSRKICSIQVMAAKRFPFDMVRVKKGHSFNDNEKMFAEKTCDNRFVELEDEEASCSSCSGPHLLSLVDKENGYDAKGKKIMSLKRRSGIRRRRKSNYDCVKFPSVILQENLQSDVALHSYSNSKTIRDETSEDINPASGKQVSALDVEDAQTGQELDEKTCHSYEFDGSMADSPGHDKYLISLENHLSNVQDNLQIVGNGENRIQMLENALEEEKAAYAALYLELEKERAAAATAADEAMAMISRLQEEKASMEMEIRQYHRMIEERVAYDEEEINILQEILIRRERENHFLEKELEAYRKTGLKGTGLSDMLLDERAPISVETCEDPLQTESTISVKKDEISNIFSSYMIAQTEDGEEPVKSREHKEHAADNVHSSFYDTEPDVLDDHDIDENNWEEENEKISNSLFSTVLNEPRNKYLEFGSLEVQSSEVLSNCPRTNNKTESDTSVDDPITQFSAFNSRCKTSPNDSGRDSSCPDNNEKLKIGSEIQVLGEKLKMVQHEKEKLTFFEENGDSGKGQFKPLEERAKHLRKTRQLKNPVRGASLPPSSAKVNMREKRSQSAIWDTYEST